MTRMVGPAGKDGCCVFNCMEPYVLMVTMKVSHPYREPYLNHYPYCKPHFDDRMPPGQHLPFEIVSIDATGATNEKS